MLSVLSHGSGMSWLAPPPKGRKLMLAPSSRVIARAALAAVAAAIPAVSWASVVSVGATSGVSPVARPISAYWLVE